MNEHDLRNSIRGMEDKLKQTIDRNETIQRKLEEAENELVALKEENRHLNKCLQESKSQIQQLEFERNSLLQEVRDIRLMETEATNTRIINDRMMFENDRLDRYILALIHSHGKQSIQPFMEGSM